MHIVASLALAATAAAPAPQQPQAGAAPVCQNSDVRNAGDRSTPLRSHTLKAEPPARQILTVLRTVDGCSNPVVVREDVGAPERP